MSDLRARLAALEQRMREPTASGFTMSRNSAYWADELAALLRESPEVTLTMIGPNVEAHLRDFLTRIIDEQGCTDHVWLVAHATGLLKGLDASKEPADA